MQKCFPCFDRGSKVRCQRNIPTSRLTLETPLPISRTATPPPPRQQPPLLLIDLRLLETGETRLGLRILVRVAHLPWGILRRVTTSMIPVVCMLGELSLTLMLRLRLRQHIPRMVMRIILGCSLMMLQNLICQVLYNMGRELGPLSLTMELGIRI
jgi:hypothetical protein